MIETVFNQRNNPNTVVFSNDDGPLDFTAASRMVLKFNGSAIEADTDVDASLIDYSGGSGVVVFKLNDIGIPGDLELQSSLIVYDPLHPDGQIVVHAVDNVLYFRFVDPI